MKRSTICIVSPATAEANNGNWHTASRWAAMLAPQYDTSIVAGWPEPSLTAATPVSAAHAAATPAVTTPAAAGHAPPDLLIALHARRSAAALAAFRAAHPGRPAILLLTGTDLYRDIRHDASAQQSLQAATALVLLQPAGLNELPPQFRSKAHVIYQSAPALPPLPHAGKPVITMIGHLREEKDPLAFMRTAAMTDADLLHIGGALDPALADAALSTQAAHPNYRWLGPLPHEAAREQLRRSHAMAICSRMEGGANVIIEAVTSGVPVLASDIPGNRGMLGDDYEGYFPPGDAAALARLIGRSTGDQAFHQRLRAQCAARAHLFAPEAEQAALRALVDNLLLRRAAPPPHRQDDMSTEPIKLTSFSHGGGCGCKIAPGVLSEILKNTHGFPVPKELLVGIETADDAAVYKLNDEQALIATTDFFMPIVDDPFDFGRIAATNAISDVYAMGGTPIMALALVGMPVNKLPIETIGQIIKGGESICAEAGIPIAGGHTIDSVEPIYGLVVMGLVHPSKVKRNADAKAGDVLILGKPLGVGVLSAALKKDVLGADGYQAMIENTTKLNKPGKALSELAGVHALTDVTGFGLLGHLLELARGAKLTARLNMSQIPLLPGVEQLAHDGFFTGASGRNWAAYGNEVQLSPNITPAQHTLLTDPQTSGGLLVSCDPSAVDEVLALFAREGFAHAAVIGEMAAGEPRVQVAA